MSLIETVITVAISMIVILGVTQFLLDLMKAQSRVQTVNAIATQLTLLERDLMRVNTCSGFLAGMTFNPSSGLQNLPSSPNLMAMKFQTSDKVSLIGSQMQSVRRLETIQMSPTITYERHLANLQFQFRTSADAIGGRDFRPRTIPLQVLVNVTTNAVVSCQAEVGANGEYCILLGGTYNPSGVPQCKLPIFTPPCSGGTVAGGFIPGDIVCVTPPAPPVGSPPQPTAPLGSPFLELINVSCSPSNCNCPGSHPMFFGGGLPGSSMTCGGMIQVAPALDPVAVMACLAPLGAITHCVTFAGVNVRSGFGPCYACP